MPATEKDSQLQKSEDMLIFATKYVINDVSHDVSTMHNSLRAMMQEAHGIIRFKSDSKNDIYFSLFLFYRYNLLANATPPSPASVSQRRICRGRQQRRWTVWTMGSANAAPVSRRQCIVVGQCGWRRRVNDVQPNGRC